MRSYNFTNGDLCAQFYNNADHITAVITNAWILKNKSNNSISSPLLSYDTALSMLLHDSISAISSQYKFQYKPKMNDPIDIVLAATGQDLTFSQPTRSGHIDITNAAYNKLSGPHLKHIVKHLSFRKQPPSKCETKAEMVTFIRGCIEDHTITVPSSTELPNSLVELRNMFKPIASMNSDIIQVYSDSYGFVDQLDRQFYLYFKRKGHSTYRQLFVMSLIWFMLHNAHTAYCEYVRQKVYYKKNRNMAAAKNAEVPTIIEFLASIINQIHLESSSPSFS